MRKTEVNRSVLSVHSLSKYFLNTSYTVATRHGVISYTNSASASLELDWGQSFSVKVQIISIWGFVGLMVSVASTQLCSYKRKAAIDSMSTKGCGCVPMKLSLQKQMPSQKWPMDPNSQ